MARLSLFPLVVAILIFWFDASAAQNCSTCPDFFDPVTGETVDSDTECTNFLCGQCETAAVCDSELCVSDSCQTCGSNPLCVRATRDGIAYCIAASVEGSPQDDGNIVFDVSEDACDPPVAVNLLVDVTLDTDAFLGFLNNRLIVEYNINYGAGGFVIGDRSTRRSPRQSSELYVLTVNSPGFPDPASGLTAPDIAAIIVTDINDNLDVYRAAGFDIESAEIDGEGDGDDDDDGLSAGAIVGIILAGIAVGAVCIAIVVIVIAIIVIVIVLLAVGVKQATSGNSSSGKGEDAWSSSTSGSEMDERGQEEEDSESLSGSSSSSEDDSETESSSITDSSSAQSSSVTSSSVSSSQSGSSSVSSSQSGSSSVSSSGSATSTDAESDSASSSSSSYSSSGSSETESS